LCYIIELFIFIEYYIVLIFKYIWTYFRILILQNNYSFNLIFNIYYTYGLYTNHIKFIYGMKHDYIIHHYTYHWPHTSTLTIVNMVKLVNMVGTSIDPCQGLCHPPTTLHVQCCNIKTLSCFNVWMYKNTKFKI